MSKWSDDFERANKDIRGVREKTKVIIEKGGKLACEEFYNANSLEKLKKEIIKTCKEY